MVCKRPKISALVDLATPVVPVKTTSTHFEEQLWSALTENIIIQIYCFYMALPSQ